MIKGDHTGLRERHNGITATPDFDMSGLAEWFSLAIDKGKAAHPQLMPARKKVWYW